ncbi:RagB/SusD family nutrient uptake outer membrane protein [Mangrovibacterium lignilyticum]|uniref:RagB/SusD family nutrient uptake outer membrane protein n=1 Tax=Mangrovibacterium lignilyticum TaxID=2668052 RepID=UPI0013CF4823|nr:RagB/SusD family nutrient uptake outer membrane protein [Mangrovibacterium lignilyticum]
MKKILLPALIAILAVFSGCGDTFLDQKNLYEKNTENYYSNPNDVDESLIGAYSCLAIDGGGNHPVLMANLLSDDCFSGGGTNDIEVGGTDKFEKPLEDLYYPFYKRNYEGILILNSLLEHFDQATYEDVELRKQNRGEACFLRAMFYFRLTKFFGEVPLDLNSAMDVLPRASSDEIYAQIASDLKMAIDSMSSKSYLNFESGRATKWAAEALMGRVFLFYTGFYNKTELPTVDGAAITKDQAVAWLEDCIANSGHSLIPNYASIWPFSSLSDDGHDDGYLYAQDVTWAGDGCAETVFAVKYTNSGDWGNTGRLAYANEHVLYTSPRAYDYPPFGYGWGIGAVNPQLRDSFESGDPRKTSTIIDNTDENEPTYGDNYNWAGWNCRDETGLWNKKYSAIIRDVDGDGTYTGMYYDLFGGTNNMQLWNMQDDILIRFADVKLMAAELGSHSQDYLDDIRDRSGLPSVTYSLAALKAERRHEFALEGIRWFDLLRWGDAEAAITGCNGVPVKTDNVDTTYKITFNAGRVFLPFPDTEIRLSNGNLEQSPGWE